MSEKSASVRAIELTREVFESIHGNLGLLKFNIEELTPTNGTNGDDSQKWEVKCSFYETIGSRDPSHYTVLVNLSDNTVTIKKVIGESEEPAKKYTVQPQEEGGP